MILFCAVDDRMGMAFGGRRQSRDSVLCEYVMEKVGNGRLFLTPASRKLFPPTARSEVTDRPLEDAREGDFCFAEFPPLGPYDGKIERLILFRWNRHYPSDQTFDLDLSHRTCVRTEEFAGSSHERITVEEWI